MHDPVDPFQTVEQVAESIRRRVLSPLELVKRTLARITALDSTIHAFITVTADEALVRARDAEREIAMGKYGGPLHGVPYAVKDVYQTKDIPTTAHSHALRHWVPDEDAAVVSRMRDAGAVLVGKLATYEFSTASATEGPFPPAQNPWNPEYIPMGSSSGSAAAVAAGMAYATLGGDTGGSVRAPAAACGCVGLRPTYGRVSRRGAIPLSWSLDTVGPLARTVKDCAIVLRAIAGYDEQDPASANRPVPDFCAALGKSISGLRIGVDRAHFFDESIVDPMVIDAVDRALTVFERLGASIVRVELPLLDYVHASQNIIHIVETHGYHAAKLLQNPEGYGPTARAYFRLGAFVHSREYLQAQRVRQAIRNQVLAAFQTADVLAAPTIARRPERWDEVDTKNRFVAMTGSANLTLAFSNAGLPAITVPCGFFPENLPIGLQLAARPFDEETLFQAAHAYEAATVWHERHPPLPRT